MDNETIQAASEMLNNRIDTLNEQISDLNALLRKIAFRPQMIIQDGALLFLVYSHGAGKWRIATQSEEAEFMAARLEEENMLRETEQERIDASLAASRKVEYPDSLTPAVIAVFESGDSLRLGAALRLALGVKPTPELVAAMQAVEQRTRHDDATATFALARIAHAANLDWLIEQVMKLRDHRLIPTLIDTIRNVPGEEKLDALLNAVHIPSVGELKVPFQLYDLIGELASFLSAETKLISHTNPNVRVRGWRSLIAQGKIAGAVDVGLEDSDPAVVNAILDALANAKNVPHIGD